MFRIDPQEMERVRRSLVLVEAAVEGADMGDTELQAAISCTLLEILKIFEPTGTANTHRLENTD